MATLAEIRQKLLESQNKQAGTAFTGDNAIYPHWNMPEGKDAVIRFLPDGDTTNTFFWAERAMIKLPFAGIKGETDSRPVQVQVPCVEMYNDGSVCPILSEVRGWFKDKSLEELGRRYWKKRSYIFQGFVLDDPLNEEKRPENPIRRFVISPQIFQLIRSALVDPDLDELPTDYLRGLDFRVTKSSKGGYADYSTSKWSRKERALSSDEQNAISQHGLFKLNEFLPKKPGEVELKVMKEMFEASVDGEAYDADKWSQYFKPAGLGSATGDPTKTTTQRSAVVDVSDDAEPWNEPVVASKPAATASATTDSRAQDILAMIRARKQ